MPFGLHFAPATFQRLLDTVLGPELEPRVFVYLDNIIVSSRTFEEHLSTLRDVFRRLREAKLRLNPDKCNSARIKLHIWGTWWTAKAYELIRKRSAPYPNGPRRGTYARYAGFWAWRPGTAVL